MVNILKLRRSASGRGFTLIELLVVIAIIGLLTTMAVVSLNSARQKARDAKRIADVKQVQTALELFFNDSSTGYPTMDDNGDVTQLTLGYDDDGNGCSANDSEPCDCLNGDGFVNDVAQDCESATKYMGEVPQAPRPPSTNAYTYRALLSNGNDCNTVGGRCTSYEINFVLEDGVPSLGGGTDCIASPSGIICS